MKYLSLKIIAFVIIPLIIISCSEPVGPLVTIADFYKTMPLFPMPEGVAWHDVTARCLISEECTTSAKDGFDSTTCRSQAQAYFYTDKWNYVNAGSVSLDGDSIPIGSAFDIVDYHGPWRDLLPIGYAYTKPVEAVFGGKAYSWSASGSSYHEAVSIATISPKNPIRMTMPANGSTLSLNMPLEFRWTGGFDTSFPVRIIVQSKNKALIQYVTDNGNYTIPANSLRGFEEGTAKVSILRGCYTLAQLASGSYAIAAVYSSHIIECWLKK